MTKKTEIIKTRIYSNELKKSVVNQIEKGELTVMEACRVCDIKSAQTIYNWIYKISRTLQKPIHTVLKKNSVDQKLKELEARTHDLEAALGRKQLELDLYRHIVELASEEYSVDLKKSFGKQASKES
jgi:transposase-like protein